MSEVVLPDCLVPDWELNLSLHERQKELARLSVDQYAATIAPEQQSLHGLHYVDSFMHEPACVEDEKSATIVPIPFATGWLPHMAARVDLLNAALGGKNRMIALPNSTVDRPGTTYTRHERHKIAGGNLAPLADKVLRLLDQSGIERVQIAGYSQGAAIGAHLARAVAERGSHQLEAVALSDTPTVICRSTGKLALDFVRTGGTSYKKAMDNTGIPLLRHSVEGSEGASRDFVKYARTVALPENLALARALCFNSFGYTVLQAALNSNAAFGFMRAEGSTVAPQEDHDRIVTSMTHHFPGRIQSAEIPGYGHEFGDNSVALALVEARVLAAR